MHFVLSPRKDTCAAKRCRARATHDGLCEPHDTQAAAEGIVPPWRGGARPRAVAVQRAAQGGPEAELATLRQALAEEIGAVDRLERLRAAVERAPLGAGAEWAAAEALLARLHDKGKTVASWQRSQIAPLTAVVNTYRGVFQPYIRALDDAKALLKRRMSAALAARAQQLQADLDAAAEGDSEALARAGAAAVSPSGIRKVREWAFVEGKTYADLPMAYLQPNYDLLDKLARAADAVGPAPGACNGVIVVSEREVVVARAKAAE